MRTNSRILIIGLDGATLDLIEPWVQEGHLPNFARLMAQGSYGPLVSTLHPATPPAWATFLTGKNQGKHGLYDFVRRKSGGYGVHVTNSTDLHAPTFYEIAGQLGRRIIAVNIPYTSPARPVNGILVGGPFAPIVSRDLVYPPEFIDTLNALVPDYFVLPEYDAQAADPLRVFANKLLSEIEHRERLCLHLMQHHPWDVLMMVSMATDEVHHTFWGFMAQGDAAAGSPYRNVIREVYQRLDQAIGSLVAQAALNCPEDWLSVFVVSDHGAGPFRWMINLNQWLAQQGQLRFREDPFSALRRLRTGAVEKLASGYRRYVPNSIRAAIRARMGSRRFATIKGGFEAILLTSDLDWTRTKAYSLGVGGNIYINLRGREPSGCVDPGPEYEALRRDLARALESLVDPETGAPVVRQVHRREDIYEGPFVDQAPDLIVEWVDYSCWGRGQYNNRTAVFEPQRRFDFSEQPLSGSHRPEGVLIASGAGIRSGARVAGARLVDMAPTILHLMGIQPPADMDGRVLSEILLEESPEAGEKVSPEATGVSASAQYDYSPEEAERIAEHLRSLGYF